MKSEVAGIVGKWCRKGLFLANPSLQHEIMYRYTWCVIASPTMIMRGRNMFVAVKRGLRNSILLSTLMYGSNRAQQ